MTELRDPPTILVISGRDMILSSIQPDLIRSQVRSYPDVSQEGGCASHGWYPAPYVLIGT